MEKPERQQPKTRVEEIKGVVLRSPEGIEEEFQRTTNSWLECFGSRLFAIDTYLYGKKAEDELGSERYKIVEERLEILRQRLYNLKQQYPDKNTNPPDEIKKELLERLDVLK